MIVLTRNFRNLLLLFGVMVLIGPGGTTFSQHGQLAQAATSVQVDPRLTNSEVGPSSLTFFPVTQKGHYASGQFPSSQNRSRDSLVPRFNHVHFYQGSSLGGGTRVLRQWSDVEADTFLLRFKKLFTSSAHADTNETEALSPYSEISIVLAPAVEHNIRYFQTGIPDRFQEWLTRFYGYQPLVEAIFQEFDLPQELIYLSLVESGFNPRAYSRARAAGPWQFMKGTGRQYGLKVNWYVDERRDPIKSTVAAAQHLRDLYDQFGTWPLAMAAYNAGAGKITRAIKKSRSRDYWKIRKTRYIRRETKDYVPRFMAAAIIAMNPTLFGFTREEVQVHGYDEVPIQNTVHLRSVAKKTGITYEELRRLNPELRRSIIPGNRSGYYLKVPTGKGPWVEEVKSQVPLWTQPPPTSRQWYRVRWGDSLSVIANRFGLTVGKLKRLNHLSGNMIRVGARLQVSEGTPDVINSTWYRVRTGDSLSVIAARFGMSLSSLKGINNLSGNMIRAGDRLRVSEQDLSGALEREVKWYRVRRGDSLWKIAKRFRMTVMDLKALNNLRSSVIRAGRLLLISP